MTDKLDQVMTHLKNALVYANDLQRFNDERVGAIVAELQHAGAVITGMDDGNPSITLYSQRDPKWVNVKLGTSNVSIGGYGCLITCAASMLSDAGRVYNPATLNTWLNANGGYVSGNHFVFNSIDKLGAVRFYDMVECANIAAPVEQFDELIKQGDFVIVKVDFNPATMQVEEHWVRYIGGGQMVDPWHGDIAPIVPRYRGKDAAQAILRAAIYKRVGA